MCVCVYVMYVCMYVCICVCVYVCVCYVCIYVCIYVCVCVCVCYVCMYMCVCVYVFVYVMCVCMYAYVCVYVFVYVTCVRMCVCDSYQILTLRWTHSAVVALHTSLCCLFQWISQPWKMQQSVLLPHTQCKWHKIIHPGKSVFVQNFLDVIIWKYPIFILFSAVLHYPAP